jgi:hypothetical protein
MTAETTHVRILIDADARLAFVSVREYDVSYPDHPFTDADSTYTSADYHGADWLAEARAIAADYAEQWGVRTIVEEHA